MGKFIEDFEAFMQAGEALFRKDPLKTRFTTKYAHQKGKLTLKVTNDHEVRNLAAGSCLQCPSRVTTTPIPLQSLLQAVQFRAEYINDLKKVERFNALMLQLMAQGVSTLAA